MKKSDIFMIVFGSFIVIACFIGYLYFHFDERLLYILSGIIFAIIVLYFYIRNYKDSSYGAKFHNRY
ncbi:hypothetical protein [Floccifex sp.]|uniref:hypothetical protein n=1 Tax=Floccifex sp. TaxID=2815810 RepID=UPI003EFC241C